MLYFTIGLPRSGKSTLCNQWILGEVEINNHQFQPCHEKTIYHPRTIVCSDDIRLALTGCRWSSYAEEMVHAIQGVMIRALLLRGMDVIVDGTHTTANSIKRMLQFNDKVDYVYVNTSQSICKERARTTNRPDLCKVIDRMSTNLANTISIFGCGYTSKILEHKDFPNLLKSYMKYMKAKSNIIQNYVKVK